MDSPLVARILAAYGIPYTRILPPQKGYRNRSFPVELPDGRYANILIYKREPHILDRITNANAVAGYAAAHGYPARSLFDTRTMQLKGSGGQYAYACAYHYLPGTTIPWEAYTKTHIKQLGAAMSNLHAVLAAMPAQSLPHVADEYAEVLGRMYAYFSDKGVQDAMRRKLGVGVQPRHIARLQTMLAATKNLPGAQALHMDFVRGNILFDDAAHITGVLDFEKTAIGHPAFDIARTLAFLLVDCKYKQPDKVRKYFLHSGYQKRGRAPLPPLKLIDALVPLFLLHDFYKFLRHNPYESLHTNEHYIRTEKLLKQLFIISGTKDHS